MEQEIEKLIDSVKEQAQMFLLDAGEFYPFGSSINKENRIQPIGVYLDNDNLSSLQVISLLDKGMRNGIQKGEYKMAVMAIDVTIKEGNIDCNAIELRFFLDDNQECKRYIKYHTYITYVEFY